MLSSSYSLLFSLLLTTQQLLLPRPIESRAWQQDCNGYASWIPGGVYNFMNISYYQTKTTNCSIAISPIVSTYTPNQVFTVTMTSPPGQYKPLGYKVKTWGGAVLSNPNPGGVLAGDNKTCIDWDNRIFTATFKLTAPQYGSTIYVRGLCGDLVFVQVTSDIIMQPGPGVLPATSAPTFGQATLPSPPPGSPPALYQYLRTLGPLFKLYFGKNATHVNFKLTLDRAGYVSIGFNTSVMSPATAIVGMDPSQNPGYPAIGLYDLVSKTLQPSQIGVLIASSANQLATYGIVNAVWSYVGGISTLTFAVQLSVQHKKVTVINPLGGGIDVIIAAGASAVWDTHSVYDTLYKMDFGTGLSSGSASTTPPPTTLSPTTPSPGTPVVLKTQAPVLASTDAEYDYEKVLHDPEMYLFYKVINSTHAKFKITMKAPEQLPHGGGYISFGPGYYMIPSYVLIGMDPIANPKYPSVGLYQLNAKEGTNDQIMTLKSSSPNELFTKYGIVDTSYGIADDGVTTQLKFTLDLRLQNSTNNPFTIFPIDVDVIWAGGPHVYDLHYWYGTLSQVNFASGGNLGPLGGNLVRFPIDGILAAHVIMMIIAWLILAPIGSFIPLAGKHGYSVFKRWYRKHWIILTLAVILAYIATLLAYLYVDGKKTPHWSSDHKKMGLAILILSIVQPLIGTFRPEKALGEDKKNIVKVLLRKSFEWTHWGLGRFILVLGVANCILGVNELETIVNRAGTNGLYSFGAFGGDITGFMNGGWLGDIVAILCTLSLILTFGGWFIVKWAEYKQIKQRRRGTLKIGDVNNNSNMLVVSPAIIVGDNNKNGSTVLDKNMKIYSFNDVAQHNTKESLWVIYRGFVYDMTDFLFEHPGGDRKLLKVAGTDMTEMFDDVGHSQAAMVEMTGRMIGQVEQQQQV
jgi:cytochrome b involved in lipid metabolism